MRRSPTQSSTSSQMPSASSSACSCHRTLSVELVAVAVAVAFRDVRTSAFVDFAGIADATCVRHPRSHPRRHRCRRHLRPPRCRRGRRRRSWCRPCSRLRGCPHIRMRRCRLGRCRHTRQCTHAVVYVVTNAVRIFVYGTSAAAFATRQSRFRRSRMRLQRCVPPHTALIELVAVTSQSPSGMSAHPHS